MRAARLMEALAPYPPSAGVVWVQEEPANMGAWRYLLARFGDRPGGGAGRRGGLCRRARAGTRRAAGRPFAGVCRPPSASPATGWAALHRSEQQKLLKAAFDAS